MLLWREFFFLVMTSQSQSIMTEEDASHESAEISRMRGEISSLQEGMKKMMEAQQQFMQQMLKMGQPQTQPPTAPAKVIYEDADGQKPSDDSQKSSEYQPSVESRETNESPDPPPPRRKKRQARIEEELDESVPSTVSSSERPIMMDSDEYHISDDFRKPPDKPEKSTLGGEFFFRKKQI